MTQAEAVRVAVIGTGGMARHHIRQMVQQRDTTEIRVLCDTDEAAYKAAAEIFEEAGLPVPPHESYLEKMVADYGDELDAVLIVTPHNVHFQQAAFCMESGLDVLLEKPMVMNADEASQLIQVRDRTGRLLVVAFNGSMSPNVRTAVKMLRGGDLGEVLSISATVWQRWKLGTANSWRQVPEIAGGGFLFDTGAHMLNTVVDLAGEEFVQVGAWLDNRGSAVDIVGVVMGRLQSGVMVTMHGCGDAAVFGSDLRVFGTKGMLRTGVWGERLESALDGNDALKPVEVPESLGTWQQFLAVRQGTLANPCPPEVGLRMARLWDAIQQSAAQQGALVTL